MLSYKSTLYIVATPIGNLEDITLRALRVLKEADLILCEDTRVTKKLLDHYKITTPTLSYHQHSGKLKTDQIIGLLKQGKNLALVTDAGTPGLSDPGGQLVAEVFLSAKALSEVEGAKAGTSAAADCQIIPIPGPSALTAAIAISGLPLDKFLFLGFLPHKKGRQTLLKKIAESEYPVVLYESVHRINKLLEELIELQNSSRLNSLSRLNSSSGGVNFKMVVCRELTKKFETVYRGTAEEVKSQLSQDKIKGEFVVIITQNLKLKPLQKFEAAF